jgi:16S rRNA (cytosine967-C5)-methyltransferase
MTAAAQNKSDARATPTLDTVGEQGVDLRIAAARVIARVKAEKRSLAVVLPVAEAGVAERDRGLLQELCYGTLRWYYQLRYLLQCLLSKPLQPREQEVEALLCLGLYQLLYTRIPAYAAVSVTVAAVRGLGKSWAVGLSNAVLRNFQRQREVLLAELARDPALSSAHPPWLLECLQADWPDAWPAVIAANNTRPPQSLRVNLRRTTRSNYLHRLADTGIDAWKTPSTAAGVTLAKPRDVERLPGFQQGLVSVQDPAAQLAAGLMDLRPGLRVLDACAAPGGKSCHLLEAESELKELVALDIDGGRLNQVRDNLHRLGLRATLVAGDASRPPTWWDATPFDRILLDAPCSATGVIRRHPDIKLLREAADIDRSAERQRALLDELWPLLAPGGMLLYATCSTARRENDHNIADFLADRADAREQAIVARWGRAVPHGRQILPGEAGMDGFYYARLIKKHDD